MTDTLPHAGSEPRRPVSLPDGAALDALLDEHAVVLVEFYTAGCGICASEEPVLGIVARATDAVVATANPRDDPPLVERFEIRSVPTFVLFVGGQAVGRLAEGFVGAEGLIDFIESRG